MGLDYKSIYKKYHSSPRAIQERSMRNKARRIKGLKVGDKREVDHKNPLSKGGTNNTRNLRSCVTSKEQEKRETVLKLNGGIYEKANSFVGCVFCVDNRTGYNDLGVVI